MPDSPLNPSSQEWPPPYYLPAEWEPHRGTWLTWPREDGISFPGRFPQIYQAYRRLIDCLTDHEPVFVNVNDEAMEDDARHWVEPERRRPHPVVFYRHPADEAWCRDHGPTFVRHRQTGELAIVNWDYNAWGGKYPHFDRDNAIPERIARVRGLKQFKPGIVLEGGSIDGNGRSLLLTTESCLLNPNRNPNLSRQEIENRLSAYLGVQEILWLEGPGLAGDDTDGHIDNLARFVAEDTIVISEELDPADSNYPSLRANFERLQALNRNRQRPFRIVGLPLPRPIVQENVRLPASYVNFYLANGVAVVPTFGDANDRTALRILQELLPERKVVGLDSRDVIWGAGSFHCLTQQEPR